MINMVSAVTRERMVEVVRISNKGTLLWIKEVPDIYREISYEWEEQE